MTRRQRWMPLRCLLLTGFLTLGYLGGAAAGRAIEVPETQVSEGDVYFGTSADREVRYMVRGTGDQVLRVAVEQRGVNVTLRLLDPSGEPLATRNSLGVGRGCEGLTARLETAGDYVLEVAVPMETETPGRFRLEVELLRAWDEAAAMAQEAEEAYLAALAPEGGTREGLEAAVEHYDRAIRSWRRLDDRTWIARAAAWRGLIRVNLGQTDAAKTDFELATAAGETGSSAHAAAAGHRGLGAVAEIRGDGTTSERHYLRAIALYRELGDPFGEADSQDSLAVLLFEQARFAEARSLSQSAISIWESLNLSRKVGKSLTAIALLREEEGNLDEALEMHHRALELRAAKDDRVGVAVVKNNIARAHFASASYQQALDWWLEALDEMEGTGRKEYVSTILSNLGATYRRLGEPLLSLETNQQAQALSVEVGDVRAQLVSLNNSGKAYLDLDRPAEAIALFEDVVERAARSDYPSLRARAALNLADALLLSWRPGPLANVERALALYRETATYFMEQRSPREASGAFGGIARCNRRLGKLDAAGPAAEEALKQARAAGDRAREEEALALIGRLQADQGQFDGAVARYQEALSIVEEQRSSVASRDLRSSYFARKHALFVEAAVLLGTEHVQRPSLGLDVSSLDIAERAHARSLLDFLRAANVEPPTSAAEARDRYRKILRRLSLREQQWRKRLSGANPEALEVAREDALRLRRQLHEAASKLAAADPRYAAATARATMPVDALRARFGRPGSVFLSYLLGPEAGLVYVLTEDGLTLRHLPGAETLNAEVERFTAAVASSRTATGTAAADAGARRLGKRLLDPVADLLGDDVEVINVVADGPLRNLPFAVLEDARGPLVERYDIVMLPSGSAALLLDQTRPSSAASADRSALVIADAVYTASTQPAAATGLRKSPDTEPASQPLPFSRVEADALVDLWPGQADLLIAEAATVDGLLARDLRRYDLIHFAVHSRVDPKRPGASGLLLSVTGESDADLVSVRDVYELDLAASLVTLSACRSADGTGPFGDAVGGLATAFLYAGARNVVATLWDVDDRASARFMALFYRALLDEGLEVERALRSAQQQLRALEGYESPYYWAPYVLIGLGS